MEEFLTIGRAARRVGLSPKTIRYYEGIGLIPPLRRSRPDTATNGYRLLDQKDLNRLAFIKKARQLGLSLAQAKELLRATERGGATPQLLSFVERKISAIDQKIEDLRSLRGALEDLRRKAKEGARVSEPCCEPVCGPITCGPGSQSPTLVQVERASGSEEE